jgi:hypothetical protein
VIILLCQELPLLARSPAQSHAVLDAVRHLWTLEWSCGLGPLPTASTPATSSAPSAQAWSPPATALASPLSTNSHSFDEHGADDVHIDGRVVTEPALRLIHPACIAAANEAAASAAFNGDDYVGPSSPPAYAAESVCQMVKLLYEHHFRCVLADKGRLGRAAIEWSVGIPFIFQTISF